MYGESRKSALRVPLWPQASLFMHSSCPRLGFSPCCVPVRSSARPRLMVLIRDVTPRVSFPPPLGLRAALQPDAGFVFVEEVSRLGSCHLLLLWGGLSPGLWAPPSSARDPPTFPGGVVGILRPPLGPCAPVCCLLSEGGHECPCPFTPLLSASLPAP